MFALLGPNGAGKTTTVHILSTLIAADGGEVRVAGHDVAREPDAVRGVIGLTGQFSAVDGLFTGEENLRLMADLRHLGTVDGPPARRRAARAVRPRRCRAASPSSTYSGGMRRRLDLAMTLVGGPADHLPRRADGRARPAQPAGHVGHRPGPRRRRGHDLPDDAVPRGGGPARGPDRGPRPRHGSSPRERRPSSSASSRAARPARRSTTPPSSTGRPGPSARDRATMRRLTLQVPSDGGSRSCASLLDRLEAASIDVDALSVQTADLDDVFLSLTGAPRRRDEGARCR